jgi:hypothetical protein
MDIKCIVIQSSCHEQVQSQYIVNMHNLSLNGGLEGHSRTTDFSYSSAWRSEGEQKKLVKSGKELRLVKMGKIGK